MSDIKYTAVFLEDDQALLDWWCEEVGPLHPRTIADHMTIEFKPHDLSDVQLGQHVALEVIGWSQDETCQAVAVVGHPSTNDIPHVTIALDGVSAFASNALLADGFEPIDPPRPVFMGYIGAKMMNGELIKTLE